jgi:hypothetical protein
MSTTHTHIHTHVNTHFCGCGRTHISAHAHAHVYPVATRAVTDEPIAKRTRAKQARITWENTPWGVADRDLADLLEFLHASNDPWERSLIPAVEKDAIERLSLRNKN